MRALATQVRLRRLIRSFSDRSHLLRDYPWEGSASSAERKLLDQVRALRETWAQDFQSVATGAQPLVTRFARRSLAGMEAAIAGLSRPGADLDQVGAEFLESALSFMFYLRGLEEVPDEQVASLVGGDLARSA